jgi:hypothetical protein
VPSAATSLTFDIFARDQASATFRRLGEQASGASDNVKHLSERLDKLGHQAVKARLGLEGDKEANAGIDRIVARLTTLNRQVANPDVTLEGAAKMRAEISSLELALDRLGSKTARPNADLSKLGFLQPSALGAVASLLPTLIPLAAETAAAVGAIGVSFGAAGVAALGFGALAGTVLSQASKDAQKLAQLNLKLNTATTAAAKKAVRDQIHALTSTWTPAYRQVMGDLENLKDEWKSLATSTAAPALVPWLDAATRGLKLIQPALKPVADLFEGLGESLNAGLADNAPRIRELAAAFGRFSATQLADVARFVMDIAKGVFSLGKDLAANGANFGAAGTWLAGIGDGFLAWSKSAAARRDVHGFMKFLRDEGPVVKGILQDLGTILPGIFAGATTVGTLELQALGDFLSLVADLPKGWQKPLTEFAGAMLLLSKIGVIRVGIKLVGLEALAAAVPAGGGPLAAAGAAMAAGVVLQFREDFRNGLKNAGPALGHDIGQVLSGLGGFAATSATGIASTFIDHFRSRIVSGEKSVWHAFAASFDVFRHAMAASFDAFMGDMGGSFRAFTGVLKSAAKGAWNFLRTGFRNLVLSILDSFGDIVHAASWAFGWIPGIGGKLRTAASAFDRFRDRVNSALGGVNGRTVHVNAVFTTGRSIGPANRAAGGYIHQGTGPTADDVPIWASRGEYVVKAASVAKYGTRMLDKINAGRFAAGGHVGQGVQVRPHLPAQSVINATVNAAVLALAKKWAVTFGGSQGIVADAMRWIGKIPYVWGGTSVPGGADCSGFVQTIYGRHGISAPRTSEAQGAWVRRGPPVPGGLALYNSPAGGPPPGHVAIVGNRGMVISQGGGMGPQLVPLQSMPLMFTGIPPTGFDRGGWLRPGLSLAWNGTGRPEQVIPHSSRGSRIVLEIQPTGTSAFDRFMADWLSDAARVRGGGSLEVAFGNHH